MCPIWPLHLIVLYVLALCPLWVICQNVPRLTAVFSPPSIIVKMDEYKYVDVSIEGSGLELNDAFKISSQNEQLAWAEWNSSNLYEKHDSTWKGKIRINGNFIGRTNLVLEVKRDADTFSVTNGTVPVVITRVERVIDTIFTTSVAVFIALIFINFGCAMHWPTVRDVIKRPIGPAIGMVGQFLFMPLSSFGLGYVIFPNSPAMRLGMFFTGVAPGGGASNVWTFILGGNLNLSLAMTTISTICSFGFMPAWLFSLGQVVFHNAKIVVPYARIAYFVVGLVVPLGIGLSMQKLTPKFAGFMVRILKGFSTTLLLFIIIFAIVTNLYIFQLFTWEIVVAGMGMPWLGYCFGYLAARLMRQPHEDALAISIETGIQNTGIAIFLLRYALGQPEADLTTVVPVSAAIMTPFPMIAIFIYQKIKACIVNRQKHQKIVEEANTPTSETPEPGVAVIATVDALGTK